MKQYSTDLRERVCQARDAGATRTEVARLFGVSLSSISRWQRARTQAGTVAAKPRPGRPRKVRAADEAALVEQVLANPEATLREQAAQWVSRHEGSLSVATLSRILARLGVTYKKRHWSPGSRTPTPAPPGKPPSTSSIPANSFSWTRPAPR